MHVVWMLHAACSVVNDVSCVVNAARCLYMLCNLYTAVCCVDAACVLRMRCVVDDVCYVVKAVILCGGCCMLCGG